MKNNLSEMRQELDEIDWQILQLLARRFKVTSKIGEEKSAKGINLRDSARERQILENLAQKSAEAGIDSRMIKSIWKKIMAQSLLEQHKINHGQGPIKTDAIL